METSMAITRKIQKKLVTDENHKPVAVQIDYDDWLEIEQQLGLPAEPENPRHTDWSKYRGTLRLTEDPLEYQRRIRDEWP
jgi:hypothetical protein